MRETGNAYRGFEQGPIRPPNEAYSLLVRVTRNCPWNRCRFCPVYKGTRFSVRRVEDVKRDIDAVHRHVESLRKLAGEPGRLRSDQLDQLAARVDPADGAAFGAALNWFVGGRLKSVFLQDADSLVMKPDELVEILRHLKRRFPFVERITSYTRARTVAARKLADLQAIRAAGLNRIHVGLESGSDEVLRLVAKGCTRQMHIDAGRKAKTAGFELSEYYMPGLGGRALSEAHARQSADVLNQIDPDLIRLRTLTIPPTAPLFEDQRAGRFEKCTDVTVAGELLTFIESLSGISSVVTSDHVLNLLPELEGKLPADQAAMIKVLRTFLDLEPARQRLYQVGRRLGIFNGLRDLDEPDRATAAEQAGRQLGITANNVDRIVDEITNRFV